MLLGDNASNDDRDRLEVERLPDPVRVEAVPPRRDAEVRRGEIAEIGLVIAPRSRFDPGLVAAVLSRGRIRRDVVARVEQDRLLELLRLHPEQRSAVTVSPACVCEAAWKGVELGMVRRNVG